MHHGTTVLHLDPDTNQLVLVLLRLEKCNGTVTWFKPPWSDPRSSDVCSSDLWSDPRRSGAVFGGSSLISESSLSSSASSSAGIVISTDDASAVATLDKIEQTVSPGLRLKYTNRSGDSLAYTEQGYVGLVQMKEVALVEYSAFPESVRVAAQRSFQVE